MEGNPLDSGGSLNRPVRRRQDRAEMIYSIRDIFEGLPVKERVKEYRLWKEWATLVGGQISKNCRPERIKDGILFLKVSSPVWAQQLQFMKGMIIEKVNRFMGDNGVKELRFRVGKLGVTEKGNRKPWSEMPLDKEILMRIDNELSPVRDHELREVIKKLRIKEAQVKMWKGQRYKGGSSNNSPS